MKNKAKAINHLSKFSLNNRQQNKVRGGCCPDPGQEPPKTQSNSATVSTQIGA